MNRSGLLTLQCDICLFTDWSDSDIAPRFCKNFQNFKITLADLVKCQNKPCTSNLQACVLDDILWNRIIQSPCKTKHCRLYKLQWPRKMASQKRVFCTSQQIVTSFKSPTSVMLHHYYQLESCSLWQLIAKFSRIINQAY